MTQPMDVALLLSCARIAAGLAAGFGVLAGSAGCHSTQAVHGERGVVATYAPPTLWADLGGLRVPAVVAASEMALRGQGYSVLKAECTEDAGRVVARSPRYDTYPTLVIAARVSSAGTRIEIREQPFGDEGVSRAVLDRVLQRLGL